MNQELIIDRLDLAWKIFSSLLSQLLHNVQRFILTEFCLWTAKYQ